MKTYVKSTDIGFQIFRIENDEIFDFLGCFESVLEADEVANKGNCGDVITDKTFEEELQEEIDFQTWKENRNRAGLPSTFGDYHYSFEE